jgi:hypothetical protein
MNPPFTVQEFLAVFGRYNEAVWPAQVVLNIVGLACIGALVGRGPLSSKLICAALALLWAWSSLYHLAYFAGINPAATIFAVLFLAGAAVFGWEGVLRGRLRFALNSGSRCAFGLALVVYALVVYPLFGMLLGHRYPDMPTFGLPCPTTLFTIGMLAFLRAPYPRYVFVFPVAWALIGMQAAFLLLMYEDLALIAAAAAGVWFAFQRPPEVHPA